MIRSAYALTLLALFLVGCSKSGDPAPEEYPASTPGTTAGTTADTPGGSASPGSTAGASGTGTTAPSSGY